MVLDPGHLSRTRPQRFGVGFDSLGAAGLGFQGGGSRDEHGGGGDERTEDGRVNRLKSVPFPLRARREFAETIIHAQQVEQKPTKANTTEAVCPG